MKKEMSNAVIYIRVSTDTQVKGTSLENQEEACLRWTAANSLTAIRIFREEGKSSKTMKRPTMQKMLDFIDEHHQEIAFFVVYQMDRLSRHAQDYFDLLKSLKTYKIELRDASEPMVSTPASKFVQGIKILTAELDNDLKGERVRENMIRHTINGERMHMAPFGLKNVRDELNRSTVVPDQPNADKIATLLHEFSKGIYTKAALRDKAHELGLKQRNRKPMSIQYIDKMLVQPLYAGLERGPLTSNEYVDSLFPGIIPKSTFLLNQDILAGNNRVRGKYLKLNPLYPLRGLLRCAQCGRTLSASASTGNKGKKYPRYNCPNKMCEGRYVKPDEIHEQFLNELAHLRPSDSTLKLMKAVIVRQWNDDVKSINTKRRNVQLKIDGIEDEKALAVERLITGDITTEEKLVFTNRLNSKAATLQAELARLQQSAKTKEEAIDYAISYMANAPRLWNDSSIEMKSQYQSMIFPEGLPYNLTKSEFGTAKMGALYTLAGIKKDPSEADESLLVTSRRIELRLQG
jgi:site-specific DNA recombinase